MTMIAKSTQSDTIFLPEKLMVILNLREGETIKAIIEGQTLRLARLESFLSLRGALASDDDFDRAIETLIYWRGDAVGGFANPGPGRTSRPPCRTAP